MKPIFTLLLSALLFSCGGASSYTEAIEQARAKLKQEGIEEIVLTPTSNPDDELLLFQVEGKQNGKTISGSVEVRLQGTPEVKLNLFDVSTKK
jgi:hypothetical protein